MPEYLSPGVYVEEIEIGGKPIEGVSTSTAGFLGETERGPADLRLITGFGQYQRLYGKHAWKTQQEKAHKSYLPYAIEGFFANGGKRCFVGRIVSGNSAKASAVPEWERCDQCFSHRSRCVGKPDRRVHSACEDV